MSDINKTDEKFYAERDIIGQGQVYVNHVVHMTSESLHAKSDIAAELAHRDIELSEITEECRRLRVAIQDAVEEIEVGAHFTAQSDLKEALLNRLK